MMVYDYFKGRPLVTARIADGLLFTSGTGAAAHCRGRVGRDVTVEQANEACRYIATRQLGSIDRVLGGFSRVKRILRVGGMVNVDPSFHDLDAVVCGFSDLMFEVLGERGIAVYSVAGVRNLPSCNTVAEFQMIVAIDDWKEG